MSSPLPPREACEGAAETIGEQSIRDNTVVEHHALKQNPSSSDCLNQEWETKARIWLSTLPNQRNVMVNEMEAWIDSNKDSLPEELKLLPRSQIYERILSIHKLMQQSNQVNQDNSIEPPHARFQRTDQWLPVYTWLESLDKNEVVKSKDISDWLSENPSIKEKLYSRHSRYHLMHYVQKCHLKILKRRGKLPKGIQPSSAAPVKVLNNGATKLAVPLACNSSSKISKVKDLSVAKRNEAFRRYELLTDLGNQLGILLSNHGHVNSLRESSAPSVHGQKSMDITNHQ